MRLYFSHRNDIDVLTPLLATRNVVNELDETLSIYEDGRKNDKTLMPLNLDRNHWVLSYINHTSKSIHYFDPLGYAAPQYVNDTFTKHYPAYEIVPLLARVQSDVYNCGVWIVEAAKSLIKYCATPIGDVAIHRKRHDELYNSYKSLEKIGLFSANRMKKINKLTDSVSRDYIASYLNRYEQEASESDNNKDKALAIKLQNEEIKKFFSKK